MKKFTKLSGCIFSLLLFSISCSKEPDTEKKEDAVTSGKSKAQISSTVVSYTKVSGTSVTSVNNYPGYQRLIFQKIGPLTVQAGDVVSAHFQQQLNINSPKNAMAACQLVIGTNGTVVDSNSPGYVAAITKATGSNCSVAEEGSHEVMSRSGSYKFTAASNSIYILSIVYGAGLSGVPDWTVPGGGELVAVVERGVDWYTSNTYHLPWDNTNGYNVPINAPTLHVQYAVNVNVPAGSMVDVRHHVQGTSDVPNGFNQRLGSGVYQGTSQTSTGGLEINKKMQNGITWGEHHSTISKVGGAYYASAVNGWFNTILYGYGTWSGAPIWIDGPTSYGDIFVEVRPGASSANFYEDLTNNISTLNSTQQVLYSVGPMSIDPGQVVEVRYQAAFQPNAGQTGIVTRIVRTTSATSTGGTTVQAGLARSFHSNYGYSAIAQSTADKNTGASQLTGQYYNVVAYRIEGSSTCPVTSWGEMEAVKR